MKSRWIHLALLGSFTAVASPPPVPEPETPPPQAAALAECSKLETSEKSECELRVRQGLDDRESGTLAQAVPEQDTPPTDRVSPVDEDGDDDRDD